MPEIQVSATPEYAYMALGAEWFIYSYTSTPSCSPTNAHFRRHGFWFPQQQFRA